MTARSPLRVISAEEIAVNAGARPAPLRLPDAGVFAERALRLRHLAQGAAMGDYLRFVAELAQGQHEQLQQPRALPLPNETAVAEAMAAGLPPVDAQRHARSPLWREELSALLQRWSRSALPPAAADVARQLMAAPADWLEAQADALLSQRTAALDAAAAPFIGAALQLHWVRLVQQLQSRYERSDTSENLPPFGLIDDPTVCPCCGARPVAAITRVSAETSGQRFLACSLCATQWHYVRIKCSHCQGTKGISFQGLVDDEDQSRTPAVQAECCESCGHYLKQVQMEKDLHVEPLADDLATLTLDLLIGEQGLVRQGFNPLLILGEPEAGLDTSADAAPGGAQSVSPSSAQAAKRGAAAGNVAPGSASRADALLVDTLPANASPADASPADASPEGAPSGSAPPGGAPPGSAPPGNGRH